MVCNIGKTDRIIRIIAGVALVAWALFSGNVIGYVGIIVALTGVFRFCPAYLPFKISTVEKNNQQ